MGHGPLVYPLRLRRLMSGRTHPAVPGLVMIFIALALALCYVCKELL